MDYPGFIGGSFTEQSLLADQERTVNLYVQLFPKTATSSTRAALYPWPGVESFLDAGAAPCRGTYTAAGRSFAVYGDTLIEINSNGTKTVRGTVAWADNTPVSFAYNGDGGGELFISASDVGYMLALASNTFSTELPSDSDMCAMLDGFFISLDTATSTFYISDLFDGGTWDPTQFAQRSIAGDPWVSVLTPSVGREIWLFGTRTSEIWYDAGTSPFPFAPQPNALIPFGIAAPYSAASAAGTVIWLAQTELGRGQVVQAVGSQPKIISTTALQYAFDQYVTIDDAIGQCWEFQGHTFYILTFPTEQATWCYDLSTGYWFELGTWNADDSDYEAWRPVFHTFNFGVHLLGDLETSDLWALDGSVYTDVDGNPFRRLRRAPGLIREDQRIFYSQLQILMDVGVGNVVAPSVNPQVMLRYSNDGGYTWSEEYTASAGYHLGAGHLGTYNTRVIVGRLGSARRRVFEVAMYDSVPWRMQGAVLKLRPSTGN